MELHLLDSVAVALGLALAGGLLARLVGLSPIVGYLAAGVVISPVTPGYDADLASLRELAELGVIFLMFGVGLHFNLADLMKVKGIALPGAVLQIAGATAMGAGAVALFGGSWREGLVLGLAISIASTVVLIRALEDRGLMDSVHARVAVGWLIVEDLATVLFLVLLPIIAPGEGKNVLADGGLALLKAGAFLALMFFGVAPLVPRVLGLVAKTGSRELFILSIVAAAMGIATLAGVFGLSVAIGAFVAGVVISETETSHQAAADVLPLREAFAVLFFVSVGMLLDPAAVRDNIGLLAVITAVVLVGKPLLTMLIAACFPYPARTGLTVSAGLAQVGEFSFIVADRGLELKLIDSDIYNILLAVAVISIAANPLAFTALMPVERLLRRAGPLWSLIDRQHSVPLPPPVERPVVVLGYGRVGELIGHALAQLGIPFTVVDADIGRCRRLAAAGVPVVWGDAASVEVLRKAGVASARLVVVAVPDESSTTLAVAGASALNHGVPVIARAHGAGDSKDLRRLGATEVIVPEYEGGLEMMRQALIALDFDAEETLHLVKATRDIHYGEH